MLEPAYGGWDWIGYVEFCERQGGDLAIAVAGNSIPVTVGEMNGAFGFP